MAAVSIPLPRGLTVRESGPEQNPKVHVEALVEALLEPLGRKQRQELFEALSTERTSLR